MQEKLVIYLHADDYAHPSWAVVDADGMVRESAYRDGALGLAEIAADKDIIVLVPAEDVLLISTTLPKMSRARLAAALPYALEEQLIADVDTLHFASGASQPNGNLPVAVVTHEKMQQWLSQLQAWNIVPDTLLPVSLALPFEENSWHIFINEMAIFRSGFFQGFACDINNFRESISLVLTSAAPLPMQIYLNNYTQQALASTLDVPITVNEEMLKPERMLADFAPHAVKKPAINLLQSQYAKQKSKFPQLKKMLQITIYLAVAWVCLLFFYPLVSYFIFKQRVSHIDDQIAVIYKNNFPQASSVIAPKLRMEEKLQKLNAQIGENRLLLLVGYVGKGMLETSSIKLKRFEFQNNQLTLELTAGSSEDFTAFTDFLTQQGLSVKQQNANLSGERISATLVIE